MNLKALEILKAKKVVLELNLKDRIDNSYNIQYEDDNQITSAILEELKFFDEAIKELEDLECKDRLTELEKVILYHYLNIGDEIGIGGWKFDVEIESNYKSKQITIYFCEAEGEHYKQIFRIETETTKEMFDKAIEHFTK